MWLLVIPTFPDRPATQISRPQWVLFTWEPTQECWQYVWPCIYKMAWDTEVSSANMVFNLLLRQRTWELGRQKFPLWGKETCLSHRRLLRRQGLAEALFSTWEELAQTFLLWFRDWDYSNTSLEVGSNNAIGL